MLSIIKTAFKIALTYGPESLELLKELKKKREREEMLRNSNRLQLCEEHNPTFRGLANYSKHNCDFCKLAKDYRYLIDRCRIKDAELHPKDLSVKKYNMHNR